ncbi:MAG: hypothetical protein QXS20_00130 [Candidatus Thorarchaeota archaeon]
MSHDEALGGREQKQRFVFKITVLGPDDELLKSVLEGINKQTLSVNGIVIGSTKVELEQSDVSTLMMSPSQSAHRLLLSLTFRGAHAALIVMREPDPVEEATYRNQVRREIGTDVPVRVFVTGQRLTKRKIDDMLIILNELADELVSERSARKK